MTTAAQKFIESIETGWQSREPWEDTAREGLSEVDDEALCNLCDETDEDYDTAEAEVMQFIREKVEMLPPDGGR